MYCNNCGSQIDETTVVCPHCGTLVSQPTANAQAAGNAVPPVQPEAQQAATANAGATNSAPQQNNGAANSQGNAVAIVGFILAFFVPLAGLICSIVGLKKANQGAPYKGLAIAGVVLSSIYLFINIILLATCGSACIAAMGSQGDIYGSESWGIVTMP